MLFFSGKKGKQETFHKIEELFLKIKKSEKICLTESRRQVMKSNVLNRIFQPKETRGFLSSALFLSQHIKNVTRPIVPRPYFKIALKERLINLIEEGNLSQKSFDLLDFLLGRRRAWASIVLTSLVLALILPFSLQKNTTDSGQKPVLVIEGGEVMIERQGIYLEPAQNSFLEVGDMIRTGPEGRATITFYEGSVVRLNTDTRLMVQQVSSQTKDHANTTIALQQGRIWSKIAGFFTDWSRFTVLAHEATITTHRSAVFDVMTTADTTTVSAVNNVIDFQLAQSPDTILKKMLVQGTLVTVNRKNLSDNHKQAVVVTHTSKVQDNDPWVADNKIKDQLHETNLEKNNLAALSDNSSLLSDSVTDLSQEASWQLTFNDLDKQHKRIDLLLRQLRQAGGLLIEGKQETAQQKIQQFRVQLARAIREIQHLDSYESSENKDELSQDIANSLLELKQLFSSVVPRSPLYEIKTLLRETELSLTTDFSSQLALRLQYNSEQLLEVQPSRNHTFNTTLLAEYLKNYEYELMNIIDDSASLETFEQVSFARQFFETILQDMGILKAMETQYRYVGLRQKILELQQFLLYASNYVLVQAYIPESQQTAWQDVVEQKKQQPITQMVLLNKLSKLIPESVRQKIIALQNLYKDSPNFTVTNLEDETIIGDLPETLNVVPATPDAEMRDVR